MCSAKVLNAYIHRQRSKSWVTNVFLVSVVVFSRRDSCTWQLHGSASFRGKPPVCYQSLQHHWPTGDSEFRGFLATVQFTWRRRSNSTRSAPPSGGDWLWLADLSLADLARHVADGTSRHYSGFQLAAEQRDGEMLELETSKEDHNRDEWPRRGRGLQVIAYGPVAVRYGPLTMWINQSVRKACRCFQLGCRLAEQVKDSFTRRLLAILTAVLVRILSAGVLRSLSHVSGRLALCRTSARVFIVYFDCKQ